MKKALYIVSLASSVFLFHSCDVLNEVAGGLTDPTTTAPSLSNSEVISGLKEALTVGITNSVNLTSVTDGFLKNSEIALPFPPDAIKVREKAMDLGLESQVAKFETTLNRVAEEAAKEALPIFKNAILSMSVQDGFAILNGGNGAATKFLADKTTSDLVRAFSPKVQDAIAKVKLTEYWEPIINKYNTAMTFTGGEKMNPDLNDYVTQRAIAGLFVMVTKEEDKIRANPAARVNDILQKVFGSLDK